MKFIKCWVLLANIGRRRRNYDLILAVYNFIINQKQIYGEYKIIKIIIDYDSIDTNYLSLFCRLFIIAGTKT